MAPFNRLFGFNFVTELLCELAHIIHFISKWVFDATLKLTKTTIHLFFNEMKISF